AAEQVSDKKDLYPKLSELVVGAVAFAILFFFMAKWVVPRLNAILEERRAKIQGDLEKAEATRQQAEQELTDYRTQLAGARDEGNRIIDEARKTAEAMRQEMNKKAEAESQGIVARAQDEIRAERDRVFQELRTQVADLSGGKASPHTVGLLEFLIDRGRGRDLPKIIDAVAEVAAERRRKQLAEVRTAVPLDAAHRGRLAAALSRATGREIELKAIVDEAVIGGVVATVGDQVFDGSIRRKLELAREQLTRAR